MSDANRGDSVIDIPCAKNSIRCGIERAADLSDSPVGPNPYYQPESSRAYHEKTKEALAILSAGSVIKEFYDLPANIQVKDIATLGSAASHQYSGILREH